MAQSPKLKWRRVVVQNLTPLERFGVDRNRLKDADILVVRYDTELYAARVGGRRAYYLVPVGDSMWVLDRADVFAESHFIKEPNEGEMRELNTKKLRPEGA